MQETAYQLTERWQQALYDAQESGVAFCPWTPLSVHLTFNAPEGLQILCIGIIDHTPCQKTSSDR